MKEMKNNLDERQEQTLLKIEHNGCWFAFWGLLVSIVVQETVFGFGDFRFIAGEWIVFMALALYLSFACMKNGIWDRRLKADPKTNFLISLIAGVVFGLIMFVTVWRRVPGKPVGSAAAGLFSCLMVFALCFLALSISARSYRKKQQMLETEPDDDITE